MFWAALTIGFLGSFHCLGMCGPIALALPLNRKNTFTRLAGILLYNIGRMLTYALLGGFFGLLGQSIVLAGYQQILSVLLGVLILTSVFLPEAVANKLRITRHIYKHAGRLKGKLANLFRKSSYESLFAIGTLNGLLPCGLVYLGIAGAVVTGSVGSGALFMVAFGLGTLPAMIGVSFAGSWISPVVRSRMRKAVPVFMAIMAVLLILRGLDLGIPYISPKFEPVMAGNMNAPSCH